MLYRLLALVMIFLSLGQETVRQYEDQLSLGGNLFLVNKEYRISADYVPDDLVMPDVRKSSSSVLMRKEAAEALEALFAAAKEEKMNLVAVSGYRSYQTQRAIYNRRRKAAGQAHVDRFVAVPGASEHQLGLAMDVSRVKSTGLKASFGTTKEGQWLAENCYRFGFILRYRKEWEDVTGYGYEPWHIRYVGVEHALRIQEMDIPLEEYVEALRQAGQANPDNEEQEDEKVLFDPDHADAAELPAGAGSGGDAGVDVSALPGDSGGQGGLSGADQPQESDRVGL